MLVLCPLVALMKEHAVHFSSIGIPAAYVSDKDNPTVRQSISARKLAVTRKHVLHTCTRNRNNCIPQAQLGYGGVSRPYIFYYRVWLARLKAGGTTLNTKKKLTLLVLCYFYKLQMFVAYI